MCWDALHLGYQQPDRPTGRCIGKPRDLRSKNKPDVFSATAGNWAFSFCAILAHCPSIRGSFHDPLINHSEDLMVGAV